MQIFKGISFLLIISFIVSCSSSTQVASNKNIQKRKYRSGLYVQTNQEKSKDFSASNKNISKKSIKQIKLNTETISISEPIFVASSDKQMYLFPDTNLSQAVEINETPKTKEDTIKNTAYDMLLMENGDEIKCKVIEISTTSIKYKKLELLDGPIYNSSTSEVFMIQFANGTRELVRKDNAAIQAPEEEPSTQHYFTQEPETPPKKLSPVFGILSLITGILGFFVAGVLLGPGAIIFGIAGAKNKRKGKGMGIAGIIIGFVDIIGALIVMSMYM